MKLDAKRLGLAGGVLWGAVMFFCTLISIQTGYAQGWLVAFCDIYPGYEMSTKGSFIGLVYGFVDGFVGLYILAWLYNKFSKV